MPELVILSAASVDLLAIVAALPLMEADSLSYCAAQ